MKVVSHSLIASVALALTLHLAPAQDLATEPKPAPTDAVPSPNAPMPAIKYDPTPQPANTPSFAPIVEKVSPSVVTISTSKNIKPGQLKNNPLFNDPMFRRFFGIPEGGEDDDENATPPPSPNSRRQRPGGGNNPGAIPNPNLNQPNGRAQPLGLGSGVIVSPEGHILTNNHVVDGADDIIVTIGNATRKYKAKKIGGDPGTDIAVLKIDGENLPAVTFADSDKMRPGDIVIAVGNPFNLTQTATMGIVSSVGRGGMGIIDYENFIQTDASINPGNSGGALVDYQGRLIGVNTAIFSRNGGNQGIGFAVPANLARGVMESILKNGKVTRGFLGVGLQSLDEDLAKAFKIEGTDSGALISAVQPGSPAEKAGVQDGDVITKVNDKVVPGPRELQLMIGVMAPGSSVDVKLVRDGKERDVTILLGERPNTRTVAQTEAPSDDPDVLDGVTVSDIDAEIRKELEVPENTKGVVITQVDPESPSATSGLKRGDVIHEVNREPVLTAKDAVAISEKVKKEKKVLLRVSTRGSSRYVVVERK